MNRLETISNLINLRFSLIPAQQIFFISILYNIWIIPVILNDTFHHSDILSEKLLLSTFKNKLSDIQFSEKMTAGGGKERTVFFI